MPEEQAEVHIRALAKLTAQQFMAVLALPDLEREGSIRALEAGQRRDHSTPEVMAVAISEIDGRLLFRWSCSCGAKAGGDYFSAAEARAAVDRHRGVVPEAPPERPTSKRLPPGARNRERQRAALFGTED